MEWVLQGVAGVLLAVGCFFSLVAGIGVLRLPDVFSRLHAAGVMDTLGAWAILAGLVVLAGFGLSAAKLALVFGLLLLTTPTACHALAKSAIYGGEEPLQIPPEEEPSKT